MDIISNVRLRPLDKSIYIKPVTMLYEQNGKPHSWDFLGVHDSVAIIIYNTTRRVLPLVKQFRPPVYISSIPEADREGIIDTKEYPAALGITIETCAGIVDKKLSLEEIAAEEVYEECGYKVDHKKLVKVSTFKSGVGHSGALQTLFYCEVTDAMKETHGGGVEDEMIEVIEWTADEVKEYMKQEVCNSPPSFLYAMHWFFAKMKIDFY